VLAESNNVFHVLIRISTYLMLK